MKWTLNPPSRPVQIALLAFVVAGMAVTPLVNRFNGASNKDYPLWYATGQKFVQGEPLYPTDGSVFPFMYPPFAGFALGAISLLGPTGMVVALVLLNVPDIHGGEKSVGEKIIQAAGREQGGG